MRQTAYLIIFKFSKQHLISRTYRMIFISLLINMRTGCQPDRSIIGCLRVWQSCPEPSDFSINKNSVNDRKYRGYASSVGQIFLAKPKMYPPFWRTQFSFKEAEKRQNNCWMFGLLLTGRSLLHLPFATGLCFISTSCPLLSWSCCGWSPLPRTT